MLFLFPRRHSVIGARNKPNQIPGACLFGAHMTSGVDFCFFFASPYSLLQVSLPEVDPLPPREPAQPRPGQGGRGGSNSEALDPALCIT